MMVRGGKRDEKGLRGFEDGDEDEDEDEGGGGLGGVWGLGGRNEGECRSYFMFFFVFFLILRHVQLYLLSFPFSPSLTI